MTDSRDDGAKGRPPEEAILESTEDRDELLRLASVVAHQLRSPLNAVQTVLGSVLGGFAGPLDPRQRWLLEKAFQRCGYGIELVRDLLKLRTFDQLDEDSLVPVNLVAAFATVTGGVGDRASERGLEFSAEVELPDADRAWVLGEAGLIREILTVLLDNAIKYTPEGGRVGARLYVAEVEGRSTVCTEVVDTGIGIPPEGYEKLFREFYRAPNARQMAAEGTGLGLAFAWRAARSLGGKLIVEPADEQGTRAVLCLPQRLDLAEELPDVGVEATLRDRPVSRRVVVVGGVAAGSKAAAKIMRLDPDAQVTIVERGRFLAYAGCGLPFYISGAVTDQRALLESPLGALRGPAYFRELKNVSALDSTEAIRINREAKTVRIRSLVNGEERELDYDALILATGARAVRPPLPGVELPGIHTLHGVEDAEAIRSGLRAPRAPDVVIVGGGLLGCQIAEAVALCGARLTLVERTSRLMALWDPELSALIRRYMERRGVRIILDNGAASFEGEDRVESVVLEDGSRVEADLVLLTTGLKPEVSLAREAGLELGVTGAIRVDSTLRTSDPEIFAVGDCAETRDVVSGREAWAPGAAAAAIQGRLAAVNVCGGEEHYPGVTRTIIVKVFEGAAARTGLTEGEARDAGYDPVCAVVPGPDRAHFVPTARSIIIKLVVDRESRRVLGAQGLGEGEVAKRIDVVATAIMSKLNVDQLAHQHLAYAPPYSTAMDNVVVAANVVRNKLAGQLNGISACELWDAMRAGSVPLILDVRQPEEYGRVRLRGSRHVPLGALRGRLHELPRSEPIIAVCSLGLRAYEAARIMAASGFTDVRVLDGGLDAWPYAVERLA